MSADAVIMQRIHRDQELRNRIRKVNMDYKVVRTELGFQVVLLDAYTEAVIRRYSDPVSFLSEMSKYVSLPLAFCDLLHDCVY